MGEGIVRFGILGAGMISRSHAAAILHVENAELLGVSDVSMEAAHKFAVEVGENTGKKLRVYETFEDMLADSEIDAVCICTPSGLHAQNAIEALVHHKHVVLEKPMALAEGQTDEVIRACEESGCMLTVISQMRFQDEMRMIREMIAHGAFGEIAFCDLYMKYWRSEEYYSKSPWKGTLRMDGGGALMNQGIHGVDLLLYLVGDVKVINSRITTRYHKVETEDVAVAMLELKNGALGVIEASTCTYPGFERRLEILCSKGCVILQEGTIVKLVVNGETLVDQPVSADIGGTANDPSKVDWHGHAMQITNFVKAVQGKEKLLIDAHEGSRAVKLICSIYKTCTQDEKARENVYKVHTGEEI